MQGFPSYTKEKKMENTNIEQKISTTLKIKHEDREYTLSFPGDARLQELWDFIQACAAKVIEASKQNEAIAKAQQSAEETPDVSQN